MAEHPVYLYGIVRAAARDVDVTASGVAGGRVRVVEHGDLGALVSDVASMQLRARRSDLMAHSDVLQEAVAGTAVLPMGFGAVFTSADDLVTAFLQPHHDVLVHMLERFDGSVEIQVKAAYDEDSIAREIAADRGVQKLQARAKSRGDVDSKIELGRRFAEVLDRKRRADGRAIVDALAPVAQDVALADPVGEYGLVNASFLVPRTKAGDADAAVRRVEKSLDGRATVRCLGPLPPYSFVDARELVAG